MRANLYMVAFIFGLGSCSEKERTEQTAVPTAIPDSSPPKSSNPSKTVFVTPIESGHTVTALPIKPLLIFEISNAVGGLSTYSALLLDRMKLIGADSKPIELTVGDATDKEQAGYYPRFSLSPLAPLAADHWYWLQVVQDDKLRVQSLGATGTWSQAFFTGSAPRVMRAEWSLKGPNLNVEFTEAVEAKNLDVASLLVVGGKPGATCLLDGASCIDPSLKATYIGRVMNFALSPGVAAGSSASLNVGGDVMGSGRTVAQGASATGDSLTALGGAQVLSTTVASDKWTSCQGGYALCWNLEKSPPSSP